MTPARFEIGQKHKQESEAGSKASWNTPRSDSRPTMSYPSRMALAFALTSLMTVLVLVGVVSVVWGTVFFGLHALQYRRNRKFRCRKACDVV